jgi:lipopolysaccharide biosynthesis glycosyltransferase
MPKKPLIYKKIIKPAFPRNNIAVVFATNKKYLPYLAVALLSLIKHSSSENNYDLCVLHDSRQKINNFPISFFRADNISLRFIPLTLQQSTLNFNAYRHHHYSSETFLRFFIPQIFRHYQRIVYLDVDVLVLTDIATLFRANLKGAPLAATPDMAAFLDCDPSFHHYARQQLNLKNHRHYFCAGVMIFEIKKLLKDNFTQKTLKKLIALKKPRFVDQDVLNVLYQHQVYLLPQVWDVMWNAFLPRTLKQISLTDNNSVKARLSSYQKKLPHAKIIHYASSAKPWQKEFIHHPLAQKWWDFAQDTPYFHYLSSQIKKPLPIINLHWLNSFIHLYGSLLKTHCLLIFTKSIKQKSIYHRKIAHLKQLIKIEL